jgi:hemolysin activation/secretion protein
MRKPFGNLLPIATLVSAACSPIYFAPSAQAQETTVAPSPKFSDSQTYSKKSTRSEVTKASPSGKSTKKPFYTQKYLQARAKEWRSGEVKPALAASQPVQSVATAPLNLPPVESLLLDQSERKVVFQRVEFLGNTVFDNETLQTLAQPYLNREIAADDAEKLRLEITQYYVARGFINSGAVIDNPEIFRANTEPLIVQGDNSAVLLATANNQNPSTDDRNEETLRIGIVEGVVSEIALQGMDGLQDRYLTDRLLPNRDEVLNLAVLQERFQLLLQDPLFKKINSNIRPTDQKGGALLDLEVERARAWSAFLGINNYRSPSSGENQFSSGFSLRNLTSLGDKLDININAPQKNASESRSYSASFSIPLTSFNTQFSLGADRGQNSIIEPPFDRLNFESESKGMWVSLNQPLLNSLTHVLNAEWAYHDRESQSFISGARSSLSIGEVDGLTANKTHRLSLNYIYRQENFSFATRATHSQGKHNYYHDPRLAGLVQLPSNQYSVNQVQALFNYKLTDDGQILSLRGTWQDTSDYLISMERFTLTSSNSVRGYIENSYSYDKAQTLSLEWQIPLYRSANGLNAIITPFYDWGKGENTFQQTDNDKPLTFSSQGLMLSLQYGGYSLGVSYAKPTNNQELVSDGYQQSKGISYSLRYDF